MKAKSLRTAVKEVPPTKPQGEVVAALSDPMPMAPGAVSQKSLSRANQLRHQPTTTTADYAKSTEVNPELIPRLNARSGWQAANPTMNGGAAKPLISTLIRAAT